jgi:hypothetical protein
MTGVVTHTQSRIAVCQISGEKRLSIYILLAAPTVNLLGVYIYSLMVSIDIETI